MNEQEQVSQLSALFDGELPPQQAEMVVRRTLRDAGMRASWERYALIGACLRGEPLPRHVSVADRVAASLAAERELNVTALPVKASRAREGGDNRFSLFGRGALGGAIAAGVALVSILVVREVLPTAADPVLMAQGTAQAVTGPSALVDVSLGDTTPGSYTTPGENSPASRRMVDASLGYYLVAHSEEAASALRSSYDLLPGGIELTEDEISALRY